MNCFNPFELRLKCESCVRNIVTCSVCGVLAQVGGHTRLLVLNDSTVIKPLNIRELHFYMNIPEDIQSFVPRYKGEHHPFYLIELYLPGTLLRFAECIIIIHCISLLFYILILINRFVNASFLFKLRLCCLMLFHFWSTKEINIFGIYDSGTFAAL